MTKVINSSRLPCCKIQRVNSPWKFEGRLVRCRNCKQKWKVRIVEAPEATRLTGIECVRVEFDAVL